MTNIKMSSFDEDHHHYRYCVNRVHIKTLTVMFAFFELLLVILSFASASIEYSLGSLITTPSFIGISLGLVLWLFSVLTVLLGVRYNRATALMFYAVLKVLISYGCMILFLSLLIIVTNPMYITPAITFHGKLNKKYAPFLIPLSAGIGIYNCFAIVGVYKCFKFISDKRNHVEEACADEMRPIRECETETCMISDE